MADQFTTTESFGQGKPENPDSDVEVPENESELGDDETEANEAPDDESE